MPFDVRDLSGAPFDDSLRRRRDRRVVATWLYLVAAMIMIMVGLGGATRLTGSGLSIMEWAPLHGILPPLTEAEWLRLYALYQKIPQYNLVNQGFGLDGFKSIFWLEWVHRLWGRLIGLAFLGPFLWLWAAGRIERGLRGRLALLFVLGGLQGAVGWFMVASGFFPDTTAVSPYRLVVHLGLALVLYGAILWTALSLSFPNQTGTGVDRVTRALVRSTCLLVCCTILAGGFVAGLHAGLTYNTFPLMDGHLVPEGYADLHPFAMNLVENVAAVQFDHRLLATATALLAGVTLFRAMRQHLRPSWALAGLAMAATGQYALGVATLLAVVPVDLATAHQIGAVILLTAILVVLRTIRPADSGVTA